MDLSKREVKKAVNDLIEVLKNLSPITPKNVSTVGMREIYDTSTREVVKEFLDQNPTCQNDPEVSKIRRGVLRDALEQGLSLENTRKTLWKKLAKLTFRASK